MTSAPDAALSVNGVSKAFRAGDGARVVALQDVSLRVAPGEFVSLLGPSGCGKTTLLRLIDGLIAPDSGEIGVFGQPPRPGPDIGFVFQSFRLIPWARVRANIAFGLQHSGLDRHAQRARVDEVLALVGLTRFADAYPQELSGGMKQRVALARAIAPRPKILLMDEPFAGLDSHSRELMQVELMRLHALQGCVVVFVTHSVDEAIVLSDRIVLMGPRPGRVVQEIRVELPRPRWAIDAFADPHYIDLRRHLSRQMRDLVMNDPGSDFYGRDSAF